MKVSIIALLAMVPFTLVFPSVTLSRHISASRSYDNSLGTKQARVKGSMDQAGKSFFFMERPTRNPKGGTCTVEVAGSSLPDCSHACGSCLPCRLVMVSFVCASREEAETCPMAYKCLCKNKSYPVP
uniref:Epidermal patterning factor-like protein n=1 Tax=Opuntia streptacantha TaxID=393608 RepID=A0A7C9EZS7_OPUST